MSRYDSEQEQIDAIKSWWAKNGTMLLSGILIIAIAFAGWRYWQSYQQTQAANASALFEVLEMTNSNGTFGEVAREARKLLQDQPASPYAGAAALMLAQFHWEKAEHDETIAMLQWVINAKQSAQLKQIAALRLARVQTELQQFAEAQATLDTLKLQSIEATQQANVDYAQAMLALAQQDNAAASQALQRVVDNQAGSADLRNLAQLQMDDLAQK